MKKLIFGEKRKVFAGIVSSLFLVTMISFGFPVRVSAFDDYVQVGVVGPKGWIQWNDLWQAARMTRDMINDAGGMVGPGGTTYGIKLVDIDEHSVPIPNPSAAIAELTQALDDNPDMYQIIGGFRTECVAPMREAAMDYAKTNYRPIWVIAGASTNELIDDGPGGSTYTVRENYDRYKYMFRVTPQNSTVMFKELLFGFIAQVAAPKLSALFNQSPLKTYIIAEALTWADSMVAGIQYYGPILTYLGFSVNLDIVGTARPSATATSFSSEMGDAESKKAKLVIHIFSSVAGANFIRQWGTEQRNFTCIGINVESQMQQFYVCVRGKCKYESFLASAGTGTNINPNAKPLSTAEFWDAYIEMWDPYPINGLEDPPMYIAWGCYDFIMALTETFYDPGTGKGWYNYWNDPTEANVDRWIRHIESQGAIDGFHGGNSYRDGVLGRFQFTGVGANASWPLCGIYHDVYSASDCLSPFWPSYTVRAHIPQWQASGEAYPSEQGRLEIVWPQDQPYSRKWMIPPWLLPLGKESLAETDIAGGPPIPTVLPPYNYSAPDHKVDFIDLLTILALWYTTPPWYLLEADMANPYVTPGEPAQDHFIDLWDLIKVAADYGK